MNVQSSTDIDRLALPIVQYVSHEFPVQHDQIYRSLSLVLAANEVPQLYDICQQFSREEVFFRVESHRQDMAFRSTHEQLSLILRRFRNSLATSPALGGMGELPFATADCFNSNLEIAQPSPAPTSKQVCIACDISFASLTALKKHESEFCERKLDWFCPDCPDQIFGRQDRLRRHHNTVHSATCPRPSGYCQTVLAQCSRPAAEKKAWGCPCCPTCFDTLEAWDQHKAIHRAHNGKVENWSYSTMFESLLRHRDLSTVHDKYDWESRTWARRGKTECQMLRTALERHTLPPKLLNHQDYGGLTLPQALAQYAYSLSTPKSIYADPVIELPAQRAIDAPSFYYDAPVEGSTAFQPMDLKCQPEGPLKIAANPESGEHGQGLSDFTPIDEASGLGDWDQPILSVRSASGKMKLLSRAQRDRESAPEPQHGSDVLAAYTEGRQNRKRVPRPPKFRLKTDGRTPIRKQLHPKPAS